MKKYLLPAAVLILTAALVFDHLEDKELPFPVIDAHTHADFHRGIEEVSGISATQEEYFRELKDAGAVGAVSHHDRQNSEYQNLDSQNVVQCLGVSETTTPALARQLLADKKYRCIKIYLGYVAKFAYDSFYIPFYKMAAEFGVPVVFHTGDTHDRDGLVKYSDPLTVDEVAVRFRDVKFVIAHLGNPWIQSAAEVVYKNENVYVEASALIVGKLGEYDKQQIEELVIKPIKWAFNYIDDPDKFLFGTDWPLVNIKDYLYIYKKAIPKKYWRKVFYQNALDVFPFALPKDLKDGR